MSVIKLLSLFARNHRTLILLDKLKFSAGQNEHLPVLSDSPAVFAKTDLW